MLGLPRVVRLEIVVVVVVVFATSSGDIQVIAPKGTNQQVGQTLQLRCEVNGTESPLEIDWFLNGTFRCGGNQPGRRITCNDHRYPDTLFVKDLVFDDAGRYCCAPKSGEKSAEVIIKINDVVHLPTPTETAVPIYTASASFEKNHTAPEMSAVVPTASAGNISQPAATSQPAPASQPAASSQPDASSQPAPTPQPTATAPFVTAIPGGSSALALKVNLVVVIGAAVVVAATIL